MCKQNDFNDLGARSGIATVNATAIAKCGGRRAPAANRRESREEHRAESGEPCLRALAVGACQPWLGVCRSCISRISHVPHLIHLHLSMVIVCPPAKQIVLTRKRRRHRSGRRRFVTCAYRYFTERTGACFQTSRRAYCHSRCKCLPRSRTTPSCPPETAGWPAPGCCRCRRARCPPRRLAG